MKKYTVILGLRNPGFCLHVSFQETASIFPAVSAAVRESRIDHPDKKEASVFYVAEGHNPDIWDQDEFELRAMARGYYPIPEED